jgi:hypothetical protein
MSVVSPEKVKLSAGHPLSANWPDGPPTFKQCTKCHFTRPIKMFRKDQRYRDGYEGHCRACRTEAGRLRWLIATMPILLCGMANAQEPEYLGETHVRAAMVLMQPNASEAAIYLDKGFGTHPIALVATINWRLTVGADPYKYALFRIRDGGVPTDDYWVTERATWTAYQSNKNATALKAASWKFNHFTLNSDYEVPALQFATVWESRTDHLTVGYRPGSTLIVAKRPDGTWEWTARGVNGLPAWQSAATLDEAKSAAEEAMGGP